MGRSRRQRWGSPTPPRILLDSVPALCLSFPGGSAVQQSWEQGPLVLNSPARVVATLAPAPGSFWGILNIFGFWGRQKAQPCAGLQQAWQWDLACTELPCEAGRAEHNWLWLGTSVLQHGHSVWCVLCCMAAGGGHQDSYLDPISQQVAVQDQLACLPQLLMILPWGCLGRQIWYVGTACWRKFQA